ncbi:hypothetical protein L210DRAFT_3547694 [Boletus edulis BED1]|uniref:Uncharacterized protein n=1 Tax=Boletus edulis BED1 TaxID=1328754 RepID=A0AAD4BQM9_BOLED|nr:hypothetical protein L210DRAFT_3547694 [Boletus edulis BED1]
MAKPPYYSLSPMKDPLEGTSPSKADSDPPHPADTVGVTDSPGSRSNMFFAPRAQPFRKRPSVGRLWRTTRPPLQMALFPLAAICYLAFCYTVHGKVVPVKTYGLYAMTPQHLATIKGGITSISIIVISIAFFPIYDIIANLKSEEFFRLLATQGDGVPLETINNISIPSFAITEAMWRHRCSNYYILGMFASLLIWIVGTLAPGALTVDSVLSDGQLMAFAIGAVPPQSVLNGSSTVDPFSRAGLNADRASSITWAEIELGVQYSFSTANTSESDYAAFIAPVPLGLSTTTTARWLSDVIGINPTCSWASTNITVPVQVPVNSSSVTFQYFATAYLLDFNLNVQMTGSDLPFDGISFALVKNPSYTVTNHTTRAVLSDGSTVFLLGQCQSGCSTSANGVTLDLTGLNTTFTLALTDQSWTMAILACQPNTTIETREVRSDGHGLLSVQPLPPGRQLAHQGNLNTIQTTALFSVATKSLSTGAGQLTASSSGFGLGSQVQGELLFGKAQFDGLPTSDPFSASVATISPAPVENITQAYIQVLQPAMKTFLAGYFGTAYVPGRISETEIVFAASIPNLAVASAGFVLLAALIILAHFRPNKGFQFTFVNVAASIYGSDLPAQIAQIKTEKSAPFGRMDEEAEGDAEGGALGKGKLRQAEGDAPDDQQDIVDLLAKRRIFMQRRADGSPVLHMS